MLTIWYLTLCWNLYLAQFDDLPSIKWAEIDQVMRTNETDCFGNVPTLNTDQTICPLSNVCFSTWTRNSTSLNIIIEIKDNIGWAGIQLDEGTDSHFSTTAWSTSSGAIVVTDRTNASLPQLLPLKDQYSFSTNDSIVSPGCTRVVINRVVDNWAKVYGALNKTELKWKWVYSRAFPVNYYYLNGNTSFTYHDLGSIVLNVNSTFIKPSKYDYGDASLDPINIVWESEDSGAFNGSPYLILMILGTNLVPYIGIAIAGPFRAAVGPKWLIYHIAILALATPACIIIFLIVVNLNPEARSILSTQRWICIVGLILYLLQLILGLIISRFFRKIRYQQSIISKFHWGLGFILFIMGPVSIYMALSILNYELIGVQVIWIGFSCLLTVECIIHISSKFCRYLYTGSKKPNTLTTNQHMNQSIN